METKAFSFTPSHQGVCGRHGTEEQRVTSGGLAESSGDTGVTVAGESGRPLPLCQLSLNDSKAPGLLHMFQCPHSVFESKPRASRSIGIATSFSTPYQPSKP
jgi:hypothetical protein